MRGPPIPQRVPPLQWRKPALVWTPLALALAIGWPAALFVGQTVLLRLTLAAGAVVFALALVSLGASWALGRAPRTRRVVVVHVLAAGLLITIGSPFVIAELLATVGDGASAARSFWFSMSVAVTPLAFLIGLPSALISGMVFVWIALARQRVRIDTLDDGLFRPHDVQPFR